MSQTKRLLDAVLGARKGALAVGGLALVAGLGALALRGPPARREREGDPTAAKTPEPSEPPESPPAFAPVDDDEAELLLDVMAAAIAADGIVDAGERRRLDDALVGAGLAADMAERLRRALEEPLDVDAVADRVRGPEQAARVYAAARLAIRADTMQERQFLSMLAEALEVEPDAVARIEAGAA